MSGAGWPIVEDVLPWGAFTLAMIVLLAVPAREGSAFNRDAKWFFMGSLACYMVATAGSVLKEFGVLPAAGGSIITIVEVLWIPFVLFGIYAMYSAQQLNDARAALDAVVSAGEMADEIAETAPAAIVVLSDSGRITFANRHARELFSLEDETCQDAPELVLRLEGAQGLGQTPRVGLAALLSAQPLREAPVVVESGKGWVKRLTVNTSPFVAEDGSVGGAVAAFLEKASPDPA